tara:strand:+ start:1605 stop:1796 length:192 start_codon:yes stop_codon:yes gene_type:complete
VNRQHLPQVLAQLSPSVRQELSRRANRQGVSVADVMLDEMLEGVGPMKDQLYAMRRERTLRAV